MELLAKSVQQAQAAVLGVQDDLALLRAQLGEDSAVSPSEESRTAANPYYLELQTSIQRKQEAAAQLLQSSAHAFYEQFGALEEKAARLANVHHKEKELQAAKKSMQRYFDAHAAELAEMTETHDGVMRLELEKRQHLEEGAAAVRQSQQRQQLVHHVLHVWMKKAIVRNMTREYVSRQRTTRQTYQTVACDALVQQRQTASQQRLFCTWRARLHARQLRRVEAAAAESERRVQFFRQELATTQQALHGRLNALLEKRQEVNIDDSAKRTMTAAARASVETPAEHEDEVQRLRMALEEMTLEFSERTGTYIRQQEHLEQLFWCKEQKLQEFILSLQTSLTKSQKSHLAFVAQQQLFADQVNAYWEELHREWEAAMQRKEEFYHVTLLGLVGRLRHRHRSLQEEAAKLASEVHTLAPLSERCVWLENQFAVAQQLLQKTKDDRRAVEQRANAGNIVEELLTDRLISAHNTALRARCFAQWMQHCSSRALTKAQGEVRELKLGLQKQRQQLFLQQQDSAARHQAEIDHLRDEAEQLRRTNVRLQADCDAATRAQREREAAYYDGEVKNSELAAALLREKMERRGVADKWWCCRVEKLTVAESQARCQIEVQECRWWSALQLRESAALKVWTTSLHYDAAQLTAVCEGWEGHCHRLETAHGEQGRAAASRLAAALERAHLQAQTAVRYMAWRAWARERRAVRAAETAAGDARSELLERHGNELARLHAQHDAALHRQQQELTLEKTQLQAIHQERSEAQRRVHAQEQSRLVEQHRQQIAALRASHANTADNHEDTVRQLQSQLNEVGSVVVEYCAAATFARWRSWAMLRRAQCSARLQRGFVMRVQAWHLGVSRTQEDALLAKQRLFLDAAAEAARQHTATFHHHTQRLSQEREVQEARQRKLELAAEAAEREAAHLRGELQHARSLYDAERLDSEELQYALAAERRDHRTALSLAYRLNDWREASERTWWEQQRMVSRVFEDAMAKLLCEAGIDAQALHETYVDCVREHEAMRKLLQRTTTEKAQVEKAYEDLERHDEVLAKSNAEAAKEVAQLTSALSALVSEHEAMRGELANASAEKREAEGERAALVREHDEMRAEFQALKAEAAEVQNAFSTYLKEHEAQRVEAGVQTMQAAALPATSSTSSALREDSLEVGALNKEEQQRQHPHETRLATTVAEGENSNSATVSVAELPLLVFPAELAQRLRELETYASRGNDVPVSAEEEGRLGQLLQAPFVPEEVQPTSSPHISATTASSDTTASSSVTRVVCRVLETLRRTVVRCTAAQTQRYTAQVALLDTQRAQAEEALTQLRENMAGLLHEQRSLAGEIQEDLQQQTQAEADANDKALLMSQMLQERLTALTSRYARVLDAFYTDITRRQETFYSVNGMLVEVDQFSEALLQRFEENVQAMARLQHQLGYTCGTAALQALGTPVSRRLSGDDLSMMSPEPRRSQCAEAASLAHVLTDEVRLPATITSITAAAGEGGVAASPPIVLVAPPTSEKPPSVPSSSISSSSSSSDATQSLALTSPEKCTLRERVHLLEKMLVEAKVRLAEASAMADSARRAASFATPPSLQAQNCAAQDARDFADLALTEEQFLQLYAASEAAMHAIMTALRGSVARLHETQGEMSQQLQTACLSVEASVRQRCRAEVARYEAAVQSCNDSLAEATRQQAREAQRYEQLLEQQRAELAAAVEKHTRDTQLMRQSYTAEIEELTDHLKLLEEELERTRQTTQSAVRNAVARQTELLAVEHEQRLRGAEKKLTRLMAEKALLEERMAAKEDDCERRLQQERDAVARLQQQLDEAEAEEMGTAAHSPREVRRGAASLLSTACCRWEQHVRCTAELYASYCAAMAEWFTARVRELLEQEREEWETEVMHLRERVASMLEMPPSTPPTSSERTKPTLSHPSSRDDADADMETGASQLQSRNSSHRLKQAALGDAMEDASSQALTPSPQRTTTRMSKSAGPAQTSLSPQRPTRQRESLHSVAAAGESPHMIASAEGKEERCGSLAGTSPTRCRSPSLDALELSQSFLRYAKMLSDQRTRNTERLERANALTTEVDDLLLRGVELSRLADKQERS